MGIDLYIAYFFEYIDNFKDRKNLSLTPSQHIEPRL